MQYSSFAILLLSIPTTISFVLTSLFSKRGTDRSTFVYDHVSFKESRSKFRLRAGRNEIVASSKVSIERLVDKFNADIQREADQYGPIQAHALLTILRESMQAVNPNYESYRIVLKSYATWNDREENDKTDAQNIGSSKDLDDLRYDAGKRALELFRQMKEHEQSIEIDTDICNAVLQAIASTSYISKEFANQATKLLKEMEDQSLSSESIAPNHETYNYVVCILCKSGLVEEAHALVRRLVECRHSERSSKQFHFLIDLFHKIAYAYSFRVSAGDIHWKSRRKIAAKNASAIKDLISIMNTVGVEVDEYIYNPLISCLVKCASTDTTKQADEYWHKMFDYVRRTEVRDNNNSSALLRRIRHSFHDVLTGWLKTKDSKAGERSSFVLKSVLDVCDEEGLNKTEIINVITVNTVMGSWSHSDSSKSADQVENLLNLMEDLRIKPTVHTYSAIINVWVKCKAKDKKQVLKRANELLDDSLDRFEKGEDNMAPHKRLFTSIIRAYAFCGEPELATRVLKLSKDYYAEGCKSSKPDSSLYTEVIVALAKSRRPDVHWKAEKILQFMIDSNDPELLPNSYSFSNYLVTLSNSDYLWKGLKAKWAFENFNVLYPSCVETHLFNNVIKVCSICGGDESESKRVAFQTGAMAFKKLHQNDDGNVKSDSYTYGFFIKLCSNLLNDGEQKSKFIEQAFQLCDKHGKTTKEVLFQLEKALQTTTT